MQTLTSVATMQHNTQMSSCQMVIPSLFIIHTDTHTHTHSHTHTHTHTLRLTHSHTVQIQTEVPESVKPIHVCVKDKVSGAICSLNAIHKLPSFERSICIYRDGGNKEGHWEWGKGKGGKEVAQRKGKNETKPKKQEETAINAREGKSSRSGGRGGETPI